MLPKTGPLWTCSPAVYPGAMVIRRQSEDALGIRFTDGPNINTEVAVPTHRFKKASKHTDVRV